MPLYKKTVKIYNTPEDLQKVLNKAVKQFEEQLNTFLSEEEKKELKNRDVEAKEMEINS